MDICEKLVDKSVEAFILAIEIYNKPTIRYRVEGFSFFICNAWELMLKGYMMKKDGPDSIYFKDNPDRTFSLTNCVERVFTNKKDPLRVNLERIIDLRNTSTHFITEEYESIYVPLFQSCVLNYVNKMLEFFSRDVTESMSSNFLTLSVKLETPLASEIQARYPRQMSEKLLRIRDFIAGSVSETGNPKYAVLIKHDFYITKRADLATETIRVTKDASEAAFILKDTKDRQRLCPFTRKKCIDLLNAWIKRDRVNFINPTISADDERYHIFNTYHFDLFAKFYSIKDDERYCYKYDRGAQILYSYSEAAMQLIFAEIKKDPEGIIRHLRENSTKK